MYYLIANFQFPLSKFPSPCWGCLNTPLPFFADSKENGGAQRRWVFTCLIPHLFGNFGESVDPGSCKVRSPGQVK